MGLVNRWFGVDVLGIYSILAIRGIGASLICAIAIPEPAERLQFYADYW